MIEKIKQWCNTNSLSMEDACLFINEYLSYDGRTISGEMLMAILQIGQMIEPIAWNRIMAAVAKHHGYTLVTVYSAPDQQGNRRIVCRKLYEDSTD